MSSPSSSHHLVRPRARNRGIIEARSDSTKHTVSAFLAACKELVGIHTTREAHGWLLKMMAEHEEFEVMTDKPGAWPMPFVSETVREVLVIP